MSRLLHNDTVARALAMAVADGNASMHSVPGLLRRIITEDMWQARTIPETGKLCTFERFEDFVTTRPLDGLGTTMDVLRALCQRYEEVLILLDQVTRKALNENGGDRRGENSIIHNTETPKQQGTSREYTVARLERDGHQELAQRVLNREITAAAARRQVGWEFRRVAIRLDDLASAARTIRKHLDPNAIQELITWLQEEAERATEIHDDSEPGVPE